MTKTESLTTSFTLLAAGQSARMKTDKALLDLKGKPWILWQADEIRKSQAVHQLVVVDQPGKTPQFREILKPLSAPDFEIHFVENFLENSSPSDSIFCAFQAQKFANGSFVSPIDVPFQAENIAEMWKGRDSNAWALKPSYQGHGGHPVWLSAELVGKFRSEPRRLDEFLAQQPQEKLQFLEVASHWTQLNLNTPAEWQEFITDLQGPRVN